MPRKRKMWFTGQIGEAVAQVQSTGKVLVVFGKGTFIEHSILTISHFYAILRTRNIFASNIASSVGVPGFTGNLRPSVRLKIFLTRVILMFFELRKGTDQVSVHVDKMFADLSFG